MGSPRLSDGGLPNGLCVASVPALIAWVAIDADPIPGRLGLDGLTVGTPRPYTHSPATVLVWPGTGVALLWPLSDHSFALAHWLYLTVMAGMTGVVASRLFVTRRRPTGRLGFTTE